MNVSDASLREGRVGVSRWVRGLASRHDVSAVVHGAAQVFAIRLAGAALAYISAILVARWLGALQFGIYAYIWVWIVLLSAPLSVGYASSALRFVPGYLALGEWRRLRGFLRQSFAIVAVIGAAGALIGAGLLLWVFQDVSPPYYFRPALIGLACLPLNTILGQLETTARAFGWVRLAYLPGYVARPILLIVVIGTLVALGTVPTAVDALWAIFVASIIAAVFQIVCLMVGIRREVKQVKASYHTQQWGRVSAAFVMVDGFRMLLENADVLLIGHLLDPGSVAIYFAAMRTAGLIAFIYFAVVAMAAPEFSRIHTTGTPREMQRFVSGVIHLMFWPSLFSAVVLACLGPFVLPLFGAGFMSGYSTLLAALIGLVVRASIGPVEYLLNMTGHQRDTMRVYGVAAVANIALNFLLIPRFGIVGAAIATYAAIIGGNIWLYVLARHRLGISAFLFPIFRKRLS